METHTVTQYVGDRGYNWVTANGWEGEHKVRCDSILPWLSSKRVAELDVFTMLSLEMLVPCVCRGDLKMLKEILAAVHSIKGINTSSLDIPEPIAKQVSESASVAKSNEGMPEETASNFICPFSNLSLLQYSILAGNAEIVEALLLYDADPNLKAEASMVSWECCPRQYSPLYMAVALDNAGIASTLVRAGASVTHSIWNFISLNMRSAELLESLLDGGRNAIPIQYATNMILGQHSHNHISLIERRGSCYWHRGCLFGNDVRDAMLSKQEPRMLLSTPAHTADEKLIKILFVQGLLYLLTLLPSNRQLIDLDVLIAEGANPLGWSIQQFDVMSTAWHELTASDVNAYLANTLAPGGMQMMSSHLNADFEKDYPYGEDFGDDDVACLSPEVLRNWDYYCHPHWMWHDYVPRTCYECMWALAINECDPVTNNFALKLKYVLETADTDMTFELSVPCLLPAVLRFCRTLGTVDDDLTIRLLKAAKARAPCAIGSLAQIPYRRGRLHHGPMCLHESLSEEQKRVSLRMCSYSGSHIPSLLARSRDVVFSCLPLENILSSIFDLPVPLTIKSYILMGS